MKKTYGLMVFLLFFSFIFSSCGTGGTHAPSGAPAGSLDTASFNAPSGYSAADLDTKPDPTYIHYAWANAVTVQSNGKIVAVGNIYNDGQPQFAVVRYNTDGLLDSSFGTDGVTIVSILFFCEANAVAMQTISGTEYIIVAGYADDFTSHNLFAVARLKTSDGALDTTFGGGNGYVTAAIPAGDGTDDQGYGVAIDGNGKIVVAGYTHLAASGLIAAHTTYAVARFTSNGSGLDNTFGPSLDGTYTWDNGVTSQAQAVAIQNNGKIIVGGWAFASSYTMGVLRLETDGSAIDPTFGAGGNMATAQINASETRAYALALQSDGKIVAAGYTDNGGPYSFALARFTTGGVLDITFNPTGITPGTVQTSPGTYDSAFAVVVQPGDQKIIAGGYYTYNSSDRGFALVRYTTTGSLDTTFGTDGIVTTALGSSTNSGINGLALQSDGKIVAAGFTYVGSNEEFAAARYWP